MKSELIYDIPLRIFHWAFALLFIFSFTVGKFVDDESLLFSYHMLSGLLMFGILILRIIWGFFGSKYARWNSFNFSFSNLKEYLFSLFHAQNQKYFAGHNPASSWAAILMITCGMGLGLTGIMMSLSLSGKSEFEEIHEILAIAFAAIASLHILGVILHTVKNRDPIALSMITGKKTINNQDIGIQHSHAFVGIIFIGIIVTSSIYLQNNFDPITKKITLMGAQLTLGESEDNESFENQNDDSLDDED